MDFNVELKNKQILKGFIQGPGMDPSGVIVLVHGLGEHAGRYKEWAGKFANEKFALTALDLPGHGRSEGGRGKIRKYSDLYEMINILITTASRTFPGVPVYLYGHSMGGGVVLDYTLKFKPKIKAVISTSPSLKLSFEPPKSKILLAMVAKTIMPNLVQANGLAAEFLSHDKSEVDKYITDPLVHDKISAAYFAGITLSARYALANTDKLHVPALLIHGGEDKICSPEGSREFAAKTNMAHLHIWEEGYHELHNETFREEVFKYIMGWIRNLK